MVRRSAWGQGYGYEGAQAMIVEARRREMSRLTARIHAGNRVSRRLLQKLGFRTDGPAMAAEIALGRIVSCEVFSLEL